MVKLDLKLTCTISHGVLSQTIEPEPSTFTKVMVQFSVKLVLTHSYLSSQHLGQLQIVNGILTIANS